MAGVKISCILTLMCVMVAKAKPKPQFGFGIPSAAIPALPAFAPAAVAPVQPVASGIIPFGLQIIPPAFGFGLQGFGNNFAGAGLGNQGFGTNGFSRAFNSKSSNTEDTRDYAPSVNVRYSTDTRRVPATQAQVFSSQPSNQEYETY